MNEAIEQLTIDGTTFQVADLPGEIQQLVTKYEEWRERLVIAQDEALLVASALRDLGSNIVNSIKQNEAAEDARATEEAEALAQKSEEEEEAPSTVNLEVPKEGHAEADSTGPVEVDSTKAVEASGDDVLIVDEDA